MSEPAEDQPDPQPNVLKQLMSSAATRAETAGTTLSSGGGNPLSGALSALAQAWVSPAYERTVYVENLEGAGTAVMGAFDSQASHARSLAGAEPWQVDPEDPHEGWKASRGQIAARSNANHHGGY